MGITISQNGNLGIGVLNPETKLEVSGTISADQFIGNGSGLTGLSNLVLSSNVVTTNYSGTVSANSFMGNGAQLYGVKRYYVFEIGLPLEITNNAGMGAIQETGNVTRVQAYINNGAPADIQFSIEASTSGGPSFTTTTNIQTVTLSSSSYIDMVGVGTLITGNSFVRINLISANPQNVDLTIILEVTKT
jgi:hypothetical protein